MTEQASWIVAARTPRARVAGWLAALLCVALGSYLRIHTAFADPGFDRASPVGMLKSDPGLLYYLTKRVVESRGAVPDDYCSDPRIEHPDTTDVPRTFAVGQEFFAAWAYLASGAGVPLHIACVWIFGIWASIVALGVYGLAAELSGRALFGTFAAALFTVLPANYRTVGWVLMNEDFSVPWFALHLWLLARAARVRSPASILLASLALGAAVATWQATVHFAGLEAVCVLVWFLRTGRNPLAARGTWIFPATLLAFAVTVPVLRSTAFAVSLPMQVLLGLWAAALWETRSEAQRPSSGRSSRPSSSKLVALLALACTFALGIAGSRLFGRGIGEHAHVFALVWEKLRHLGQLPADPNALPMDARLMWQGPFSTLDPWTGVHLLGVGLIAVIPAVRAVVRALRRGSSELQDERALLVFGLALLSIPIAWLVERTVLLPGLLLPVVGAVAAGRGLSRSAPGAWSSGPWFATGLAGAVVVAEAWFGASRLGSRPNPWYQPPQRGQEIAALVAAVPRLVPEGEAIAADFMTSTAILAHTGHPILFQPKWESQRSRARAAELFETFYRRSPAALRELLVEKYATRYLVVDRAFFGLQRASWYAAGLQVGAAIPGTCADSLLSRDATVLASVPGYRLLYRSPPSILLGGEPSDFYRLYELSR